MTSRSEGYQGYGDDDFPKDPEWIEERDPWEGAQGNGDFADPVPTGWI